MNRTSGQPAEGGCPAASPAEHDRAARAPEAPARSGDETPRRVDLVGAAVAATGAHPGTAGPWLEAFLAEADPGRALGLWMGRSLGPGIRPGPQQIVEMLGRDVAQLDGILDSQVNAILHHDAFQRLEASWRGLDYLVAQAAGQEQVKVRVLNVSWKELARDLERAIEFDQSQLFRKVYSEEFDTPGGEPFGALVGDYEIRPGPTREHPVDDLAVLAAISHVAAAAFAPFIAAVHPTMFELEDFRELEQPLGLSKTFDQLQYLKWRALRESEDSRFVGLAMPRVLMRQPYEDRIRRVNGFLFEEDVAGPDRRRYLWGNAAYAFAAVVARAFGRTGWLASIRGVVDEAADAGGVVTGLPVHCFATDAEGIAPKISTDVVITDHQEQELNQLGFIPLCHCQDTEYSVFYANHSVQKPKRYDRMPATVNAQISAFLQSTLCVSRFAHYLKVAARDKIGSFTEASECEDYLNRWVTRYVTADPDAGPDVKARYPLREASVQVRRHPAKPGCYLCVAHFRPHFELEELAASLKITTELRPGQPD